MYGNTSTQAKLMGHKAYSAHDMWPKTMDFIFSRLVYWCHALIYGVPQLHNMQKEKIKLIFNDFAVNDLILCNL